MHWLASSIIGAAASLMPLAAAADEPRPARGEDDLRALRDRVEEMNREAELELMREDGPRREPRREGNRMEPGRPGEPGRPPRAPEPPGPGRDGMRPGGPDGPGPDGRRPGGPEGRDRRAAPDPVGPDGRPGMDRPQERPEDMEFELRMRAREIEHQIENLKWELETIRLRMEHLHGQGGKDRPAPGHGMQGPGPEKHPGGDPRQELVRRLEELERALVKAKESGDRGRARELTQELEAVRGKLKGFEKNPAGDDGDHRAKLKAAVPELRQAIEQAMKRGNHDEAKALQAKLEHVMKELTGAAQENMDRARGEVKEKFAAHLAELERRLIEAKESGNEEMARQIRQKMEELKRMFEEKMKGGEPKKPEPKKKPRMI
ncbi:MAG: hypothetical protein HYY18_08400 [Planctomycetes bacterium]|nr:hypothetical protein [Planctomycetota bacterium]